MTKHYQKYWTPASISSINRNKYPQVRPSYRGEALDFRPPFARAVGQHAVPSSLIDNNSLRPCPLVRRKGSFALRHADRRRQISSLFGRIRHDGNSEGRVYPHPFGDVEVLCRSRVWATSGADAAGEGHGSRFNQRHGSRRISGAIGHKPFQPSRGRFRAAGRH